MKKKILVLVLVLCGVAMLSVATGLIAPMDEKPAEIIENLDSAELKTQVIRGFEENAVNNTGFKKPEELSVITDCNARAQYENLSAYVTFTTEYSFTDEEIQILNKILDGGTTPQSLVQVYEFWLTTDEDFEIIEQICALEDEYFSEYWYENVFNVLTDYEHGELDTTELKEYYDKGITTDEVLAANILCRRKGQNIHNILDNAVDGISVEKQAMAIYSVDDLPKADFLFDSVTLLAKGRHSKSMTKMILSEETDLIFKEALVEVVDKRLETELKALDIYVPEETYEQDAEALKNSGYPISIQKTLINKGYTPQEIKKASAMETDNIYLAAKKARKELSYEK